MSNFEDVGKRAYEAGVEQALVDYGVKVAKTKVIPDAPRKKGDSALPIDAVKARRDAAKTEAADADADDDRYRSNTHGLGNESAPLDMLLGK